MKIQTPGLDVEEKKRELERVKFSYTFCRRRFIELLQHHKLYHTRVILSIVWAKLCTQA